MNRISTGIPGLDQILLGGWLPSRAYAVTGRVGTGKTTVGIHFLAAGESGLFISFDETEDQIRTGAATFDVDLRKTTFLDLTPDAESFPEMRSYDIFSPAEVEKDPIARRISDKIEQDRPQRVFIDGFSQFRHLAADAFQLRRLVQACFRFATQNGATLLVSCDGAAPHHDRNIYSAADGLLILEADPTGRRLRVVKFRGSDFQAGDHVMQLTGAGMIVSPVAA